MSAFQDRRILLGIALFTLILLSWVYLDVSGPGSEGARTDASVRRAAVGRD